jgi:glycosyltransferase involved in cell wall biosynthesis
MDINGQNISVIMPVFNGIGFIEKSLPPLVAMLDRKEILELIVIDDGSLDESAKMAKKIGATLLLSGGRKGPGAARNIGAKQARGDILWFVDADVVVGADAVKILKDGLVDKEVIAVFGSYDDKPAAQNFLSQYKNMIHHYYHQKANKEASTFWAGCGAVRKHNFLAVGGFDTKQFKYPSIEDIELGYRLLANGGRINLLTKLQSSHLKVWRFINLVHTDFFRRAIPWSRLMLRQKKLTNALNVSISERLRALLVVVLLLAVIASTFDILSWWVPCALLFASDMASFKLIHFFYQRKGLLFAFNSVLYQKFYYTYSSIAFLYALLEKVLTDNRR